MDRMGDSYVDKKIAVVVPCYNEETQIHGVLSRMPPFVNLIYVVDDASTDATYLRILEYAKTDDRVVVVRHDTNSGVGAAIATGYRHAFKDAADVVVVMAGDGQMDPADLESLITPVLRGTVDYCKGNRFLYQRGIDKIPRTRLIGNFLLSALTKIVSGYWHVSDTQCGYTAISRRALSKIDLDSIYPRYGCPNDILTKLNVSGIRVAEVPVNPLYDVGEESKMKIRQVILPILRMLANLFVRRMFQKYVVQTGHPLLLAYLFSVLLFGFFLVLGGYILINLLLHGLIPKAALITAGVSLILSVQLALSAFEMDFNFNRDICVTLEREETPSHDKV